MIIRVESCPGIHLLTALLSCVVKFGLVDICQMPSQLKAVLKKSDDHKEALVTVTYVIT